MLTLVLTACGAPAATSTDGPALLPSDTADHACQLILRVVQRPTVGDGYETDCSSGTCSFVWRGGVDVAETVAANAEVHVLYHLASDSNWYDVAATLDAPVTPGFRRYAFVLDQHLFGPNDTASTIEVIPYLRAPGGGRLFDHNRNRHDFDNYELTATYYYTASDEGACPPNVGSVLFSLDWAENVFGALHQGGYMTVNYALERLPQCRGTHNGFPAWDILANARFSPGGQTFSGSVRQIVTNMGTPTNDATPLPWTVKIPDDATSVELWFHNYTGAGSSCEAWDSNYGANYHFDVWPPKDSRRCRDIEKRNNQNGEDRRMYFADPYCVGYDLAAQTDAHNCELALDGIGNGLMGHYGIPFDWLLVYLRTQGDVLNAGVYTRYHDGDVSGQRFSLGRKVADNIWETGFTYHSTGPYGPGFDHTIDDFAFFADVRRPTGEVVRLWQSRGGANYRWGDAFTLPTTPEGISYGTIRWADHNSPVFACF